MVSKIFAIVGIALIVFVCIAIPLTNVSEPTFIETKNVMIFGNSGQGEIPNWNTGKMIKVVINE